MTSQIYKEKQIQSTADFWVAQKLIFHFHLVILLIQTAFQFMLRFL
jgi:hypothetical protein